MPHAAIFRACHAGGENPSVFRCQLAATRFQEKETVQRMIYRTTNRNFVVGCWSSSMSVIIFRFFDSSAAYGDFYFQAGTMTIKLRI
jgi:hypothetical protein